MRVISLGAGVQSTTLYLMSCRGDLPRADVAIFADTGWEPRAVYEHLSRLEEHGTIPIVRVSNGHIRDDAMSGSMFASIPFYLQHKDGTRGILRRQCTNEYKLKPLNKEIRRRGATAKNPTEVWIGISLDEVHRMKPARVKFTEHIWPLIDMRMDRHACRAWLEDHWSWPVPKSACIGCPFRRNPAWRALAPEEFEDAATFEERMQELLTAKLSEVPYLHDSLVPLRDVYLEGDDQPDLFGNECEGMCGV